MTGACAHAIIHPSPPTSNYVYNLVWYISLIPAHILVKLWEGDGANPRGGVRSNGIRVDQVEDGVEAELQGNRCGVLVWVPCMQLGCTHLYEYPGTDKSKRKKEISSALASISSALVSILVANLSLFLP